MGGSLRRAMVRVALSAMIVVPFASQASALTARHLRGNYRGAYAYRHHYRHYGDARVGRAVAGAALGIIGLAAGAAAANAYDRYDYGPGYGYAPSYGYGPYGYGYAPY